MKILGGERYLRVCLFALKWAFMIETSFGQDLIPRESEPFSRVISSESNDSSFASPTTIPAAKQSGRRSMQGGQPGGAAFDAALPLGLDGRIAFHSSALWAPSEPTNQTGADLGFVRQNIGVSFPILLGNRQSLFGGLSVQSLLFQTDAILPDTGIPFPDALWDVRGTLVHTARFDNGWSTVLIGSLGSTGDKPFAAADELIPGVVAVLRIPARNEDAWLASVSYQPVTGLPFPIPGIAYLWQPSERFMAQVGIPFRSYWGITDRLRFDASYLPLINLRAYLTSQCTEQFEVFVGFDWVSESYFLAERLRHDDFFNAIEMRLPVGGRWIINQNWAFDVQAGYLLDRRFFTGDGIFDDGTDNINVRPGPFGMVRLLYRF